MLTSGTSTSYNKTVVGSQSSKPTSYSVVGSSKSSISNKASAKKATDDDDDDLMNFLQDDSNF